MCAQQLARILRTGKSFLRRVEKQFSHIMNSSYDQTRTFYTHIFLCNINRNIFQHLVDTDRQTLPYFSRSPGLTPPTRWCGKGSPPWGSSSLTASVSPPCPPSASAPPGRTTGRPSPARRRTRQTGSRTQPQSGEICANSAIFLNSPNEVTLIWNPMTLSL